MVLEYCRYWARRLWQRMRTLTMTTTTWWSRLLPAPDVDWKLQVAFIASTVAVLWVLLRLWRSVRERQIRIIPASWNGIHAHQWSLIQCLTHRATCCVCRSLIVDAMFCDCCGVCLDFSCYEVYMSKFKFRKRSIVNSRLLTLGQCKTVSVPNLATIQGQESSIESAGDAGDSVAKQTKDTKDSKVVKSSPKSMKPPTWNHSWIHGNLPTRSKCLVCGQFCDIEEYEHEESLAGDHTLYHYRCCWCQRVTHEHCFDSGILKESKCDFGHWAKFILPPFCLLHKRVWSSRARGRIIVLDSVKDFRILGLKEKEWTPLFVVANRKSGNNDAGDVLRRFSTVLNPLQVIDLSQDSSQLVLALQICSMLPQDVKPRFLVAGGDGTVGWVLNTVREMEVKPEPSVAIYPLGTGNDLARILFWMNQSIDSSHEKSHLDRNSIVQNIFNAQEISMDRWSVDIRPTDSRFRAAILGSLHIPRSILPAGNRQLFMYNYFSVGVDALVALNFHETRKGWLYKFLFTNTLVNKFIYFTYGTKDFLERRCANLDTRVRLTLDGNPVQLPQLESILILNISSYGGGVKLKIPDNLSRTLKHSLDDGKVEVFGLCSSLHIGQIMVGLSQPIFLGQASTVHLELLEHLPVQVDGEPWLQSPANVDLQWNSHAKLLRHYE